MYNQNTHLISSLLLQPQVRLNFPSVHRALESAYIWTPTYQASHLYLTHPMRPLPSYFSIPHITEDIVPYVCERGGRPVVREGVPSAEDVVVREVPLHRRTISVPGIIEKEGKGGRQHTSRPQCPESLPLRRYWWTGGYWRPWAPFLGYERRVSINSLSTRNPRACLVLYTTL